jgi:SAM-dependent methyltransferase
MRILDAGCGRGDHLLLMAPLVSDGELSGLDRDGVSLALARDRLTERGWLNRVRLDRGDLYEMEYAANSFDLVWSSHVFHGLSDLPGAAARVRDVLRSGGRFVLRENRITTRLLPDDLGIGEPGLESRLNFAFEAWLRKDRAQRGPYPGGWLRLLREAGFEEAHARSFLYQLQPPFSEGQKAYLRQWLDRKRQIEGVSEQDRNTIVALTDPRKPEFFLQRNDLYFTTVSTIYIGTAP